MANSIPSRVAMIAAQIASFLGPGGMRIIARINKYVTNPLQRVWASRLRHMAVIEHTGRKSGKTFRTPVMAFVENGALSVVLNYGVGSDWVRNVQAAGSAGVEHRGEHYRLTNPRVLSVNSPELPIATRGVRGSAEFALHGTLAAG